MERKEVGGDKQPKVARMLVMVGDKLPVKRRNPFQSVVHVQ